MLFLQLYNNLALTFLVIRNLLLVLIYKRQGVKSEALVLLSKFSKCYAPICIFFLVAFFCLFVFKFRLPDNFTVGLTMIEIQKVDQSFI